MRCQWKRPCWLNLRWKSWWCDALDAHHEGHQKVALYQCGDCWLCDLQKEYACLCTSHLPFKMHSRACGSDIPPIESCMCLIDSNSCQSDAVFSYSFRISACYKCRCLMSAWSNQSTRLCMLCTFHEGVLPGQQQKLSQPFPGLTSQETLEQFLTPRTSFRS